MLLETIPVIVDLLGDTFKELNERLPAVLEIVKYEQEVYKSLRNTMTKDVKEIIKQNPKLVELEIFDYPGFVQGYHEFLDYKKVNTSLMTSDIMYRLHSTFGFDLELLERLAELEEMKADSVGFENKMKQLKKSFSERLLSNDVIATLDGLLNEATLNDFKYDYSFDDARKVYHIEPVTSEILSIVDQRGSISNTTEASGSSVKLVVRQSPFYYESGGQESDAGYICKNGRKFELKSLSSRKNCVLHEVELNIDEPLKIGDEIQLNVDEDKRTALIRNHSATHLLNSAMRKITKAPIYQKSSLVTSDQLKIEFACFGPKISHQQLAQFEELIRLHINERPLERKIRVMNSQDLQDESDVVMVPGEVYPEDGIRLVTFGDFSKELCCGTHVFNTKELMEFAFLSMRSTGRNSYLFTATTGPAAVSAISIGDQLVNELKALNNDQITQANSNEVLSKVREVSIKLNNSNVPVAFMKKLECQNLTAEIKEKVKQASRGVLSELLDIEMKSVVEQNADKPAVVHFLSCSDLMKSVSLQKATRYLKDRPVLIISLTNGIAKARCCVPVHLVSDSFNAELWMNELASIFKAPVAPPKGQNPREVCLMKEKKIHAENFDELLASAMNSAERFANI